MRKTASQKTASQDDALYALRTLRAKSVSAKRLCERMEAFGYSRASSQLAMQRATDAGVLLIGSDWRVSAAP